MVFKSFIGSGSRDNYLRCMRACIPLLTAPGLSLQLVRDAGTGGAGAISGRWGTVCGVRPGICVVGRPISLLRSGRQCSGGAVDQERAGEHDLPRTGGEFPDRQQCSLGASIAGEGGARRFRINVSNAAFARFGCVFSPSFCFSIEDKNAYL